MKGATERARRHGIIQCDQACHTHVYIANENGMDVVYNAADDKKHMCPTNDIARYYQYRFNMIRGKIIEQLVLDVQNALDKLKGEMWAEISLNKQNAHLFDDWKRLNREEDKKRRARLNLKAQSRIQ